jgi:hypothetical protein
LIVDNKSILSSVFFNSALSDVNIKLLVSTLYNSDN